MKIYDTIVIGAGSAGLFYAALTDEKTDSLILEKGKKPGRKLLLSGNGQCNITHGGSIKDFVHHYGLKGPLIRSMLYKGNNISLMNFLEQNGIRTFEREDGKVFPASKNASDILNMLVKKAKSNGFNFLFNQNIRDISINTNDKNEHIYYLYAKDTVYACKTVIIAVGGCSYPNTGSDGSFHKVIEKLGITISSLKPALTPIYPQNYPYGDISGISFDNVKVSVFDGANSRKKVSNVDSLLLTHKGFSGPAVLNISRFISVDSQIEINYVYPLSFEEAVMSIKEKYQKNTKELHTFICNTFSLPSAFVEKILVEANISPHIKANSITGEDMTLIGNLLTKSRYSISHLGGFNEAMSTSGGVALDEIEIKTAECKKYNGMYFIGEVLDVDGDTGGYNLQFAYSSALAAVSASIKK